MNNTYAGRPSVCRSCGALVGAGESACEQCGVPLVSAAHPVQPRQAYDREAMRFARAVLNRPYVFTIIFLVANFFIFLLMWHSSGQTTGALLLPSEPVLEAYGAKLNWLINRRHEWWRFVTPIFIHVGIIHLLVNMYSLWVVGPYVEKLYGSAKFVVFWVLTGIAGVFASYLTVRTDLHLNGPLVKFLFKDTDAPSAGASGALFGLVGVLFIFGIKFRRELPEGFKRAFGTGLLPMIFINLIIGYLGSGLIDNAAHVGGFVSGALLALVVGYKRPGERPRVAVFWHILQALALLLVAASFLMVVRHFPQALPKQENAAATLSSSEPEARKFVSDFNTMNRGWTVLAKTLDDGDASKVDETIKALDELPHTSEEAEALRRDLKSLLGRARDWAAKSSGPRQQQSKPALLKEKQEIISDFEAWQERQDKWGRRESAKYGYKLTEPSPSP